MSLNTMFELVKKLLKDSKRYLSEEEIESFAYIIAYTVVRHRDGEKIENISVDIPIPKGDS